MKILCNKFVIAAFVLSMLIVLGAYFGGQRLYKTDLEFVSASTVQVSDNVLTEKGINSHSFNAREYGASESQSVGIDESPSFSEWHHDDWDMPETENVSEMADAEQEVAMRQIRWEKERIKELEAELPPLLLSNPDQFHKELDQHLEKVINETQRLLNEGEKLLNGASEAEVVSNKDSVNFPKLSDVESVYLETARLRRKLEEFSSQYPDEALIPEAIELLKSVEASRDEDEALTERLLEKLIEKGIEF